MTVIANAKNTPLSVAAGSLPNMAGGLLDWLQPMVFTRVQKVTDAFQALENAENINFQGVIQPLSAQRLMIKPEGQRAWTWQMLHASPSLTLKVDEIVIYLGIQTRVMARKDYKIYGYIEYELVQDWGGSGPSDLVSGDTNNGDADDTYFSAAINSGDALNPDEIPAINGGDADTSEYEFEINGGNNP